MRRMSLFGSAQIFIRYLGDSHPNFMLHIHLRPVFVLYHRNFWKPYFRQDVTKGITNFHTSSITFLHSACTQIQERATVRKFIFRECSRQKPRHSLLSKCPVHGKHVNELYLHPWEKYHLPHAYYHQMCIMCQSLITNFTTAGQQMWKVQTFIYTPKESLALTVRIFMKFTITQFLWTSLVPNFKQTGQKMLHILEQKLISAIR
jgi:hypothetical protein